jgi:hypothetical protein
MKIRLLENLTSEIFVGGNIPIFEHYLCYDQADVDSHSWLQRWSESTSGPEVCSGYHDDEAGESAPHAVGILHVEDPFKSIQC